MVTLTGKNEQKQSLYKIGVAPGKFLPPHLGHIGAIINATTKCEKLYVVVSDHPELTNNLCQEAGIPIMDMKLRTKWLSQELQGFDHIKIVMLDETGLAIYPYGWEGWSARLKELIPEEINVIFGGEPEYKEYNDVYFPEAIYELFDYTRDRYPISGTEIRNHPLQHWDYILGSARSYFAKKILITGTESCGKTTITKYLSKLYNTTWSQEEGRYYASRYLGGNEELFTIEDFDKIASDQYIADMKALENANRVVFHDTDAVVTQYYAKMYTGLTSPGVENYVNPDRYDVVLLFKPDVKWVADGSRWNEDTKKRWELHEELKQMYIDRGFGDKIIEISGNYSERLESAISVIDKMIK